MENFDEITIKARMWMDANDDKWGRGEHNHFVCYVDEKDVPDYVKTYMQTLNHDMDNVKKMFKK